MAEKLYRAGEVARRAGISRKTLHAYVQLGLVQETRRTVSGYRLYDESVFGRLKLIRRLLDTEHSLQEIRETYLRNARAGGQAEAVAGEPAGGETTA